MHNSGNDPLKAIRLSTLVGRALMGTVIWTQNTKCYTAQHFQTAEVGVNQTQFSNKVHTNTGRYGLGMCERMDDKVNQSGKINCPPVLTFHKLFMY